MSHVICYSSLEAAFAGGGELLVCLGNALGPIVARFPNSPEGGAEAIAFVAAKAGGAPC